MYKMINRKVQKKHYINWKNNENSVNKDNEFNFDWEKIKTFCYKNVTFVLLLNLNEKWDVLIIKINLKYIKK